MIRRPPRSTLSSSSAASDVYKRQGLGAAATPASGRMRRVASIALATTSLRIVPPAALPACRRGPRRRRPPIRSAQVGDEPLASQWLSPFGQVSWLADRGHWLPPMALIATGRLPGQLPRDCD